MLRRVPWIDVAVVSVLGAVSFLQSPGELRFDSKLQLLIDPWGFLAGALSAWDPANFGQVQNQSYGYLWPMGPFFGVLHSIGLPAWVAQALWVWLILSVAYAGVRLLARRLGLPAYAAVIAGVAYAVAPRVITELGPLSEETLPAALAPWMLLPLVGPRHSVVRTAFLAAIPVFMMGAVNASATLAVLPIAAIFVIFRCVERWRILGCWLAFVAAFSLWWIVPLVIQGRVATSFLGLIESAADTTSRLNAAEVLRGNVQWLSPLVIDGQPWWPAGFAFATSELMIVATMLVAALGVFGLASRRMPARVGFAVMFAVGMVIMSLGAAQSLGHEQWWALLDGPLAPFRNIHKFDPLVRLPLAIGAAAAVTALARMRRSLSVAIPVSAVLVVIAGLPLVSPGIAAGRTWSGIPQWWHETAAWLDVNPGRALVVPGAGFDTYVWGRTVDNPLQALSSSDVVVDTGLPLGNIGTQRLLDGIQSALREGRAVPGLSETLLRSGVQYLVVRNDIDATAVHAPSRAVVAATLQQSPGFQIAAVFGTVINHTSDLSSVNFDSEGTRPAVEIYRVAGTSPRAAAVSLADIATATGASESLIPMIGAGVLGADQPVVFADDPQPAGIAGPIITTDSLVRRDRALGRGEQGWSSPLTAADASRLRRALPDMLPFADPHFTVAVYEGIAGVTASTSTAFADSLQPMRVERQPFAALDGNGNSWWQSSSANGAVGQWWRVTFDGSHELDGMTARFLNNPLIGSPVTGARITTDSGSFDITVPADGVVGPLRDPALAAATWMSITVLATQENRAWGDVALSEVTLPGINPSMWLKAAAPPAADGRSAAVSTQAVATAPPCVAVDLGTRCDPLRNDVSTPLHRIVDVAEGVAATPRLVGVVRPGSAAADLFSGFDGMVTAAASTWLAGDPNVRPTAAVDGNTATAWVADPLDSHPSIDLEWGQRRTISSVQLLRSSGQQQFATPLAVTVTVDGESYSGALGAGGVVRFAAVTTDHMSISIDRWSPIATFDTASGLQLAVPPAIGEIVVPGLEDLIFTPLPGQPVAIPCGLGPALTIDGRAITTRIDTTLGDILNGRPMSSVACDQVSLSAGTHHISIEQTGLITPTAFAIGAMPSDVTTRAVAIDSWAASDRRLLVGAGAASILRVTDAANPGWSARLDGVALASVRVDGWQQGWVVPAGAGGYVELTFTPTRVQQWGMLAGAVTAIAALAIGVSLRGRRTWQVRRSDGLVLPWSKALRWMPVVAAALVVAAIIPVIAGAALLASLLAACAVIVVVAAAVCSSHG